MRRAFIAWLFVAIGVSGCATNWQHASITDPQAADRQFKMDDGYCTLVAVGSAPMPPMPAPQQTASTITGQLTVRNMTTGQSAIGNYTATTVPSPATSFANGVSNGVAMGALFAAQRNQDRIHDACMLRKGWMEAPRGAPHTASRPAPVDKKIKGNADRLNVSEALTCHMILTDGRDLGDIPLNIENGQIWSGVNPVWGPVDIDDREFKWAYDLGDQMKQYAGQGFISGGIIERDTGEYHEYVANTGNAHEISHGMCR